MFDAIQVVVGGSDGKESARSVGCLGWIAGSGRFPGEGNGSPLQCSRLENSTQRSLVGYRPWDHKESDTTELLTLSLSLAIAVNGYIRGKKS